MTAPAGSPTTPAIETRDLTKRYRETTAVDGLSLRVERGEVFGFLGPNGAGKSTTVKMLLGLARPTGGDGEVLGRPLGDREARRRVGYLPELFRYQQWLSAREVLALHCELIGIAPADRAREIRAGLELVGLSERSGSRIGTFSKGMQQRLGLAVALLGSPELVFLDEPTSALDPIGRLEVRAIIEGLKERGTTVFLDSHLLTEVERVCDRVAIVDRGRVVATGAIAELTDGHEVRIRVDGLDGAAVARLGSTGAGTTVDAPGAGAPSFGTLELDSGELRAVGIDAAAVPALVSAIVGLGGRIHAVEPLRRSLEERFLAVVRAAEEEVAAEAGTPAGGPRRGRPVGRGGRRC